MTWLCRTRRRRPDGFSSVNSATSSTDRRTYTEQSVGSPSVDAVTAPLTWPRDVQRARVYRAEDAWASRLDAARQGAGLATVGGSRVLLPAERRFGTLETAGAYAGR